MNADEVTLKDARELLEAAARFAEHTVAREELEGRVVLLARRLTKDWRLTDEEAVRTAGQLALRLLRAESERGR